MPTWPPDGQRVVRINALSSRSRSSSSRLHVAYRGGVHEHCADLLLGGQRPQVGRGKRAAGGAARRHVRGQRLRALHRPVDHLRAAHATRCHATQLSAGSRGEAQLAKNRASGSARVGGDARVETRSDAGVSCCLSPSRHPKVRQR
eukprot:scaffold654_cov273-Prasinococcus_capsulatus_cf.AAC.4